MNTNPRSINRDIAIKPKYSIPQLLGYLLLGFVTGWIFCHLLRSGLNW